MRGVGRSAVAAKLEHPSSEELRSATFSHKGRREGPHLAVFGPRLDSAPDFLSTRREFRDEYPSEQADRDAETSLR
ncbi:hypothetical protein CIT25_12650 [Mesorhizobium mediterraneum]|uniref:Uncharacterized protein n=1 Tax=Mesorhizobium mediterraneum TaxID=43617 RepID=A0AB36RD00_9HYPH|nr:hypothetical protein CIT25_12650 [Mesorhizobium mediterraneum]